MMACEVPYLQISNRLFRSSQLLAVIRLLAPASTEALISEPHIMHDVIRLNEAITLKDTPSLELILLNSLIYYIAARNNCLSAKYYIFLRNK